MYAVVRRSHLTTRLVRMALPCIFSLLRADFHTEHEENIIDLYPALKYCSG